MKLINLHVWKSTVLCGLLTSVLNHRQLIFHLARRDVAGRYRGSILGLAWSFVTPLVMLIIYTFIFSVVFQAKWGTHVSESRVDFAIILFVGLIVHGFFAECVIRAPDLIVSNSNYVKRVVFPLEIFPVTTMVAALFHGNVSLVVLLVTYFLFHGHLYLTFLFFPLVLAPLVLGTLGISWFLAALGVYLRDVGQTVQIITSIMLFMSPVFFSVSSLPQEYQVYMYLNPLTFIIEEMRAVVIWGKYPHWFALLISYIVSITILWLGYWFFQKTRKGFADVV